MTGELIPARPPAAQAHALRAAAVLLQQAGIAGLSVNAGYGEISIQVPGHPGSPAGRAAAVARIAVLAGAQAAVDTRPGAACGWVHARGHAAGHDVRVLDTNVRARRFCEAAGFQPDGSARSDDTRGFLLREIRYRRILP